jgi:hypothetical protein
MSKQTTKLGTFACVDGLIRRRNIVHDVEKDRMRIIRDRGCLGNMKCSTVVYNHQNKLKDNDQNEHTILIVTLELESTLNGIVRETEMPPKS